MSSMNNELISVIVPVYNVEKYLRYCLDSILNQTYKNLQVILVDDGSADGSGAICDEYANNDARVEVFHQKNAGPSTARNKGLELAKGDYLSFVDSDDRMHPKMLEDLVRSLVEYPECQISICQFKFEESYSPFENVTYRVDRIVDGESLIDAMFTLENTNDNPQRTTITSLINKLYRRDAIIDIAFSGRRWFEDYEYNIQVYNRISKAVVLQGKYFCHLVRSCSLAHLPQSRQGLQGIDGLRFCYSQIPMNLQTARTKCLERLFYKLLYSYSETRGELDTLFTYKYLQKIFFTYILDYIKLKGSLRTKVKTIVYMLMPDLFCILVSSNNEKRISYGH